MILNGPYDHNALHLLGATYARSNANGTTYVIPDIDISQYETALLTVRKAAKKATVQAAYEAAMISGFTSLALGAKYWYDTDDDRKAIMANAFASGVSINYGCYQADINNLPIDGTFSMRLHTNAQIRQIIVDAKTVAEAYLTKLIGLINQVYSATSIEAVELINW